MSKYQLVRLNPSTIIDEVLKSKPTYTCELTTGDEGVEIIVKHGNKTIDVELMASVDCWFIREQLTLMFPSDIINGDQSIGNDFDLTIDRLIEIIRVNVIEFFKTIKTYDIEIIINSLNVKK